MSEDTTQQLNTSGITPTVLADLSKKDLANLSADQKLRMADSIVDQYRSSSGNGIKLDLTKAESLDALSKAVEQFELWYDAPMTREFVRRLSSRLDEEAGSITPKLLQSYKELLLRAKFLCLDILTDQEIIDLVGESLVSYLSLPTDHVDVIEKLSQSLVRFIWPPDAEPFIGKVSQALESNKEQLFGKDTLATLLKDYLSAQVGTKVKSNVQGQDSNTFGRVSYLNKKAGENKFSAEQRNILNNILELDDWLRFGWKEELASVSKETEPTEEIRSIIDDLSQRDGSATTSSEQASANIPRRPPTVPAPANRPAAKVGMNEVSAGLSIQKPAAGISLGQMQPQPLRPQPVPPKPVANIGSVLPNYTKPIPGATVTAESLAAQMQKRKTDEQSQIDQKLQALEEEVKQKTGL